MTRQVGNEIDEFVTSALRNNLLGLPLDLATINLARGRDTGAPSLNEARAQFYEATNQDPLLKPYESWVDFAGHLKHEASIINFIAAYGTHATITAADTLEEKRDAAMALVGLTATGSETVALSNASFEDNSLADGAAQRHHRRARQLHVHAPDRLDDVRHRRPLQPGRRRHEQRLDHRHQCGLAGPGRHAVPRYRRRSGRGRDLQPQLRYRRSHRHGLAGRRRPSRLDATTRCCRHWSFPSPRMANWSNVVFDTGAIGAAVAGQTLRIEIQQTGGSGNQILVDDIQLNILRPLAALDEEDRQAFLNGTGQYADDLGGLNLVDLWIGGLAEEIMPFGGMLGSTFNFVFEVQMEKLQSGDRFYYLQRLDGLHLFGEMENNSFAAMIMRNTDATHLPSDVFSTPGLILEVDQTKQYNRTSNWRSDDHCEQKRRPAPAVASSPRTSSATIRRLPARTPTTCAIRAMSTFCSAAPN